MSSPAAAAAAVAGDVLPALPPIKTTATAGVAVAAAAAAAAPSTAAPGAKSLPEVEEAEPTTPTSEESRLRPPAECPPAPRKPAWTTTPAKRKAPSSEPARRVFFAVPRDLSAVFRSLPPKKRIRAG